MSDIIKYGALALGAYLLYNKLMGDTTVATAVLPQTPEAVGTPLQNTVPTTQSSAPAIRDILLSTATRAGNPGPNSFDVWNWYYAQVRGVSGPPWEATNASQQDRSYQYTVDEYLALIVPNGFGSVVASRYEAALKRYIQ
jgi:hypothetical protein